MPDSLPWIHQKYQIQFLTPAFLGGANQSGQWRTPPFKALLRQWWRVAFAAQMNFQVDIMAMRAEEGRLFGNAWLERQVNGRKETDASRSLVRLRLSSWQEGNRNSWQGTEGQSVRHPEVNQPVGPHLYLGFGPLIYNNAAHSTALKVPPCIEALEQAEFQLALPEVAKDGIEAALRFMDLFGAVGGRSRNGWGSFWLKPANGGWQRTSLPLRDWQQALALDWPHCIGRDDRGALIWRTAREYADWKELMRDLATLKIALRTQFRFSAQQGPHPSPEDRHWLAYPVTNHKVTPWEERRQDGRREALNLRLPTPLRFKVRCMNGDSGRLIGIIYHMPCSPPAAFAANFNGLVQVWQRVHRLLDELGKPINERQLPRTLDQRVMQQIACTTLQRSQE